MPSAKPQPVGGRDPVSADPKHYTVETENERVRVLRAKYGAKEKSAMHSHPASVIVFLTAGHGRFTYPDGRSEEFHVNAGGAMYTPAVEHLPENLTDEPIEVLLIELKG